MGVFLQTLYRVIASQFWSAASNPMLKVSLPHPTRYNSLLKPELWRRRWSIPVSRHPVDPCGHRWLRSGTTWSLRADLVSLFRRSSSTCRRRLMTWTNPFWSPDVMEPSIAGRKLVQKLRTWRIGSTHPLWRKSTLFWKNYVNGWTSRYSVKVSMLPPVCPIWPPSNRRNRRGSPRHHLSVRVSRWTCTSWNMTVRQLLTVK